MIGMWIAAQVYELGAAIGVRDDGVHFLARVKTYAGDPDKTYEEYLKALMATLEGDSKALSELGAKHPGTMAGLSHSTVEGSTIGGAMLSAGVTGMLAAIAIPAFLKYKQRSADMMHDYDEAIRDEEAVTLEEAIPAP